MADPNPQTTIPQNLSTTQGGSLSFPSNINNAAYYTRLTFYQYQRAKPSSTSKDQLRATVILPLPLEFGDAHAADWGQSELYQYGGVADKIGQSMDAYARGNSIWDIAKETVSGINIDSVRAAGVVAMSLTSKDQRDSPIGNMISQKLGAVVNPHLTLTFGGMALRQHQLSWRFSPRTSAEGTTLGQIISKIRIESLASYNQTVGKFALDYPSTVKAEFVGVSKDYKTPIFKSVILDMKTNLGPSGLQFYANGVPVEVEMSLSLQETDITTREDYANTASQSSGTGSGK